MRERDPYERLAKLVVRAQAGERAAFDELYQLTAQAQYFNIASHVGNKEAADLLQEVYLVAWKNIAKIRPRAFVGYLSSVSRTLCLRHHERTRRSRETTLETDDLEFFERQQSGEARGEHTLDPAIVASTRDDREQLTQALREELDDREREIILLRFYQEMRIDAIAEALDISPSTVKRDIRHALDKLRARLGTLPRGAAFPVFLSQAVEHPLAKGTAPKLQRAHARPFDWLVRAVAAASALVVIGCLGAALAMERPAPSQPEIIEEIPVPAVGPVKTSATPADASGPTLTAMGTARGLTELTLEDESSVAEVSLAAEDGSTFSAVDIETAGAQSNATVYRFEVPSGTYTLTAIDALGNIAEGTITVTLPPEEPQSISEMEEAAGQ